MWSLPRLVLSAVRGGAGKTTLALGIAAAWRKAGRRIAVFKKGPDFIDAGWLGAAAGRLCYNLDPFLMEEAAIRSSFAEHSADADAALIEGNRGLYDGVDETGTYSTARLATMLGAPVALIVDGTKATGTVAAVVLGCMQYDPAVRLRGVILNNVSPGRHETVIRRAVEQRTGIPVVGAVPRLRHDVFPERHMGLTPFQEHPEVERAVAAATAVAEEYLDLKGLWNIAEQASGEGISPSPYQPAGSCDEPQQRLTIGVIQDRAFQFYYPDNLDALARCGAEVVLINALRDNALPALDALYIGGGFPETQAAELARNTGFCQSLKAAAEQGLPIYAECGGLIYLGRSLRIGEKTYPMTAVFPADFCMEKRPQAHGYTVLEVAHENPFFDTGAVLKGHEFHYSRIMNPGELPARAYRMQRGAGIDGSADGLIYKNVLGTYTHLHALGTPEWARGMIRSAAAYRRRRTQGAA